MFCLQYGGLEGMQKDGFVSWTIVLIHRNTCVKLKASWEWICESEHGGKMYVLKEAAELIHIVISR